MSTENSKLKFLNRKELIEIIYQLKKNELLLQRENERLQKQLADKRIRVEEAGSVADASLALSDVFRTAQTAADAYLAEIAQRRRDIERDYTALMQYAQKQAEAILRDAAAQKKQMQSPPARPADGYAAVREKLTRRDAPESPTGERNHGSSENA